MFTKMVAIITITPFDRESSLQNSKVENLTSSITSMKAELEDAKQTTNSVVEEKVEMEIEIQSE